MGLAAEKIDSDDEYAGDYLKEECIDGIVFRMFEPAAYQHADINGRIYMAIAQKLGKGPCKVYMENLDLACYSKTDDKAKGEKTDYVVPDIMIVCESELLKKNRYYGVPKFVVETFSPSTAKRDKTSKMRLYERLGVSEYWIANPVGLLEIYYLEDGKYELVENVLICHDKDDEDYNEDKVLTLREYPNISMTLGDIFA